LYGSGEQFKHGQAIDKMHGTCTAETLRALGDTHSRIDRLGYEWLISEYKAKAKQLMREKCAQGI
jgi:hypothetical protein